MGDRGRLDEPRQKQGNQLFRVLSFEFAARGIVGILWQGTQNAKAPINLLEKQEGGRTGRKFS